MNGPYGSNPSLIAARIIRHQFALHEIRDLIAAAAGEMRTGDPHPRIVEGLMREAGRRCTEALGE
jgi:hypothetical protein